MLVKDWMTKRPITVTEDTSLNKALDLMRRENVRRFPVVDKQGKLVGIVLEKDLLYASPSPATTLSVFEIHTLLSKITVDDVMARDVITVTEDTALEEAARIMADHKIGGLPVMRGELLVGIITETDLFKLFLEMFGARSDGVRLSIMVPDKPGVLAEITGRIAALGGNIAALGTIPGEVPTQYQLTIKVTGVPREQLVSTMQELGAEVLDSRFCSWAECQPNPAR